MPALFACDAGNGLAPTPLSIARKTSHRRLGSFHPWMAWRTWRQAPPRPTSRVATGRSVPRVIERSSFSSSCRRLLPQTGAGGCKSLPHQDQFLGTGVTIVAAVSAFGACTAGVPEALLLSTFGAAFIAAADGVVSSFICQGPCAGRQRYGFPLTHVENCCGKRGRAERNLADVHWASFGYREAEGKASLPETTRETAL